MHQSRDEALSPLLFGAVAIAAAFAGAILGRVSQKPRFDFRNKTVLITGGSRGLGLELARVFAREGANVCLAARNTSTLETARDELKRITPGVLAVTCDVRNREDIERTVRETVRRFGTIDILVNNAGVMQVGPVDSMTIADYENAMNTHAWASLHSVMSVLPHLRAKGGGRVVNIISIGGRIGVPHMVPYVMSKFAQAGLSEALHSELAREGIVVTSVYPGLMRTGSHVNATFKGDNKKEFAWFSIGAGMPLVSINAERAARQIIEACREGKSSIVLTPAAKAAAIAHAVSPSMVSQSLRTMNSFLPSNTSNKNSRSGWESRSAWSPSPLTALADRAVERNNEHRAVG